MGTYIFANEQLLYSVLPTLSNYFMKVGDTAYIFEYFKNDLEQNYLTFPVPLMPWKLQTN